MGWGGCQLQPHPPASQGLLHPCAPGSGAVGDPGRGAVPQFIRSRLFPADERLPSWTGLCFPEHLSPGQELQRPVFGLGPLSGSQAFL